MKIKNIKLLLPLLAILSITSCTNLDVDVKSEYTTSNFPATDADMEAVCGPLYTTFKVAYGRKFWHLESLSTDECMMVANGGNWYDNGNYANLCLHNWKTDNGLVTDSWTPLFSSISTCNQIKSILDATTESAAKTKALAEVRTMRALFYFWAMDNFGDLPIITKFGQDTPARSPRDSVALFIESELKDCMSDLSTTTGSTTYGKPTKYMAEALLAKLYLNWAVYTASDVTAYTPSATNSHLNDVVAMCDSIIKSGKYDLSDDWISKFKDSNSSAIKDFIFAIPYNWSTDNTDLGGGLTHFRFWGHALMKYTFGLNKAPSGPMRALPEFVDKFNLTGDVRNKIWRGGTQYYEGTTTPYYYATTKKGVNNYYTGADGDSAVNWEFSLSKELYLRGNTDAEKASHLATLDLGDDEIGRAMGYRCVKIYPTAASTTNWQSNDMPILRYADVLLMKAEAILRGATATNGDTPASLVNQIRNCAKAPTVTSTTLDELLDERAREFVDECWRRNDLIRFGEFEKDWGFKSATYGLSNTDKYRRIFPVPYSVMTLNTNWTQNSGYSN